MDQDNNRGGERDPFRVRSKWQAGPRTSEWGRLWRRISADIVGQAHQYSVGNGVGAPCSPAGPADDGRDQHAV